MLFCTSSSTTLPLTASARSLLAYITASQKSTCHVTLPTSACYVIAPAWRHPASSLVLWLQRGNGVATSSVPTAVESPHEATVRALNKNEKWRCLCCGRCVETGRCVTTHCMLSPGFRIENLLIPLRILKSNLSH